MVRNRVISFPRQIIVCLSLSLIIALFSLSCQKDDGIKPKDPSALTTAQAKDYFEQTAQTLKFITAGITPTGTKNADNSFTSNMVLEWTQALEGDNAESYFVEIPVRMASPVFALLYDGIGHLNKNIRQVQMSTSLLIEKHKEDGCIHHSIVTTIGSYSTVSNESKYCFLSDKQYFSGYQIFSTEDGLTTSSFLYKNGISHLVELIQTNQITKVDSTGSDFLYSGIRLMTNYKPSTKGGGGGPSSGEDFICPYCQHPLVTENGIYMCISCNVYFYDLIGVVCPDCNEIIPNCLCVCPKCGFPNRYGNHCLCGDYCPYCGANGCDGNCEGGEGGNNNMTSTYTLTTTVNNNQRGYVTRSIVRPYYFQNEGITLTAHPYTGYTFSGWYEDNVLIYSLSQYYFTITEDRIIEARFEEL
ncbi:MAG: hypothetical protein J6X91_02600 [Bacteroidales bacterium]|nr:hypothetical protein [Bacteroidales bacterium]